MKKSSAYSILIIAMLFLIVPSLEIYAHDMILVREYMHFISTDGTIKEDITTRRIFTMLSSKENKLVRLIELYASPLEDEFDWPEDKEFLFDFGQYVQELNAISSGIDMPCRDGIRILSVADGIIEETGHDTLTGNYIVISHGNDICTIYGHLDKYLYQIGDSISEGKIIGYCGNMGLSSSAHLFFAIKYKNAYLDPDHYMKNLKYRKK